MKKLILIFITGFQLFAQELLHNNMPADGVLGQNDFTTFVSGTSADLLKAPSGVAVDPITKKIFVADRYNHRVLRWGSEEKMINGSPAEAVLGQIDFTSNIKGLSVSKFNEPLRVFVDSLGTLWVSDYLNNRVLKFDNASFKSNGSPADGVLGQPDFNSNTGTATVNRMKGPVGVYVDSKNRLWVADRLNHRVLCFYNSSLKTNGSDADFILGQPDFTSASSGISASKMNRPMDVFVDHWDNLWVTEDDNNRAIRFNSVTEKNNGAPADGVIGQKDLQSNFKNYSQDGVSNLRGIYGDDEGRIYIVDESNHRVLVFEDAANLPDGAYANYVLGKEDFGNNPIIQQEIYDPSTLNYLLFLPRVTSHTENGKYPLIIFLHGIGESGSDLWKLKNEGLPEILDGNDGFPFIVISPQCPSSTEWYYNDGIQQKINKLLDSALVRYPVDSSRIYLTGFSMGGIGTLDLAIRYPDRFAALLPIAFRIEDGWNVCTINNIPIWAFHGARDPVIPLSKAQSVIDSIKSCGGSPLFTIYPDLYHDSWTRTYNNPLIYEWLLSNRKK